jgi:predicted metalloendopeptidase
MISTKYTALRVGYGSGQTSAWQKLKTNRANLSAALSNIQSNLSTITTAFATAQLNRISGEAYNAAQAGLTRVQAQQKAAVAARNKQLDAAQGTLNSASSTLSTSASSSGVNVVA